MWFYSNGWWWWWLAFVVVFFFLPLGYGWGYRGWGPWYRRRHYDGPPRTGAPDDNLQPGFGGPEEVGSGWGWGGAFLWIILIIALIWLIAAWGWGGAWTGRGY